MFPDIYKGFILSDGKIPKTKIIGSTLLTYDEAISSKHDFVGVLDDGYIMVDFDDTCESEKIIEIIEKENINCNILKTSRGCHVYFRAKGITNNSVHVKTAIGLTIDIKLGIKNTVDPLRIEGNNRKWLKISNDCEYFPFWLTIIKGAKNLKESTTRNDDLYRYILPLQGSGFTNEQIKEISRIINTYILDTPIPEKELDIILRDEAFSKPVFFNKGRFMHNVFAKYLIDNDNVIKIDDIIYSYFGNRYDSRAIEKNMIKHIPTLTRTQRKEVLFNLELTAENKSSSLAKYISVKNGILNIDNDELIDHSHDYIIANVIKYEYDSQIYDKLCDNTLNKIACKDKNMRLLLEEVVGYCLFRRNELGKFFILTGDGANGKSTFLDMIKKLLGTENISSLSLQETQEKFKAAQLVGKLANIGDDISGKMLETNEVFKKLVTGESVNVERKGMDPFDMIGSYTKFLFACNKLPRVGDTTNGWSRRMEIVPFNANFSNTDKDYDPYISDKLLTDNSIKYLLKLAIQGLKRVIQNRNFTVVNCMTEAKLEYEKLNNPILQFVEDEGEENIINENTTDIYLRYSIWCNQNGYKAVSNNTFGKELHLRFKFKSKRARCDGKLIKIYIREDK